jgi:glucose-6-phosphate isomerase, archaeal
MKHLEIMKSPVEIKLDDFYLKGSPVINQTRKLKDISPIFKDQEALKSMSPEMLCYTVQLYFPVPEGTPGAMGFGNTFISPGKVGNEYIMTKGHFHPKGESSEFYWGVQGKGMLIMMDRERNTWAEEMYPGSLHYIGENIAHRVANTGDTTLTFGASWTSDAGHDYETIAKEGFSARLVEIDGKPALISESRTVS